MAERLNYLRFISHFRAVHRGASFAGLRTTSVRKLLPEYALALLLGDYVGLFSLHVLPLFSCHFMSFPVMDIYVWCRSWGFMCPVHTPDGEPCGLLNHMTSSCRKCLLTDLYFFYRKCDKHKPYWHILLFCRDNFIL